MIWVYVMVSSWTYLSKPVACLNPLLIRVIKLSRFTLEMKIWGQWFKCLYCQWLIYWPFIPWITLTRGCTSGWFSNTRCSVFTLPHYYEGSKTDLYMRKSFGGIYGWEVFPFLIRGKSEMSNDSEAAQPFVEWRHRDVLWSACRCYVH